MRKQYYKGAATGGAGEGAAAEGAATEGAASKGVTSKDAANEGPTTKKEEGEAGARAEGEATDGAMPEGAAAEGAATKGAITGLRLYARLARGPGYRQNFTPRDIRAYGTLTGRGRDERKVEVASFALSGGCRWATQVPCLYGHT